MAAAAALASSRASSRVLLVGDHDVLLRAAALTRVARRRLVRVDRPEESWRLTQGAVAVWQPTPSLPASAVRAGKPSILGGAAQLAWIDVACDLVARGGGDALVTGPVSKEAIARSGAPRAAQFLGHTEHLARRLRAREVVMAFHAEELSTALVTTHLPLAAVPRAVTPVAVARATYWLARLLADLAKRGKKPRLAVASLNPHAGEGGLLGHEETRKIEPGIVRARARLAKARVAVDVVGPVPAESAFRLAESGRFDGVVAMYHDQATIPMKLLGFGEAVNVSLGLPIVRTSVDHGTAYDLAGRGEADPRGMRAALDLAARLAVRR